MSPETTRSAYNQAVKQFSVFADNKVGRLNDLIIMFENKGIHILAACTVDSTDSSIIRFGVDYWEVARDVLREHNYSYSVNEVVVVEFNTEYDFKRVTCGLLEAEINIHYIYPLLSRPEGRCGLILRLEDNDLAHEVLTKNGIKVLTTDDIAR